MQIDGRPVPSVFWGLNETADLSGYDALVHAAFSHLPGRYRGGEGNDPDGFKRQNLDGSLALFQQARDQGVGRIVFLSSRAVFDGYARGTLLAENASPAPTSLYGEVKARAEAALSDMTQADFQTVSLRATGVYGRAPGTADHKWSTLLADFLGGRAVGPAIGTEIHGADLGRAALILLQAMADADRRQIAGSVANMASAINDGAAPRTCQDIAPGDTGAPLARQGQRRPSPDKAGARRLIPAVPPQSAEMAFSKLPPAVHVSDILLDRRDMLEICANLAGRSSPVNLPPASDRSAVSVLDCRALHALGWRPGGWSRLRQTLAELSANL